MRRQYSKPIRKKLQRLSSVVYQRDLDSELAKLNVRFDEWQAGEIDCFELSDLIHEFHDGVSRKLWKFYNRADPDTIVVHGLMDKIISREEAGDDVLEQIRPLLERYEQDERLEAQERLELEKAED